MNLIWLLGLKHLMSKKWVQNCRYAVSQPEVTHLNTEAELWVVIRSLLSLSFSFYYFTGFTYIVSDIQTFCFKAAPFSWVETSQVGFASLHTVDTYNWRI